MSDADGADFPPETNPRYRDIHERDHAFIPVSDGGLAVPRIPEGYEPLEIDGPEASALLTEDLGEGPKGPAQLRALAGNLRDAAECIERMAEDEELPELLVRAEITFYSHEDEVDLFKRLVRLLGGERKKGGYSTAFWVQRFFGDGEARAEITIHAPSREAVCTKRVVGYNEVAETRVIEEPTGRTIREPVVEWDCKGIL